MSRSVVVQITREPGIDDIPLPRYETEHSAGMDVRAAVTQSLTLAPGERLLVPTGLRIALPDGYEAQIRPRSGLAAKHGITLPNSPGTIDADYRGEIKIIILNLGHEPFVINRGDRIAQMIIAPVTRVEWTPVDSLNETARGAGGFGHTGR